MVQALRLCANTRSAPIITITIMIGSSHHFFRTLKNFQNSPTSPLFAIYVPFLELVRHLTARLIALDPVTPPVGGCRIGFRPKSRMPSPTGKITMK